MKWLQLIIAEGILGYLLQCGGFIMGICAVAKKRINWMPLLLVSILFSVIVFIIRTLGRFNFGVHTMMILLMANLLCVLYLKVDVRHSILGSLLVTAIILAGELFDYGLLMIFLDQAAIDSRMADPIFKAWAAVPGNLLLCIIVTISYLRRIKRGIE